ncbi:hypothetical protein GCM10010468_23980 [Actinocorallia longicatena]|uniref:non-specific serine/threonine protein kinase n=2 Tax=Actinocorallia longicatena TaxID=111803 RepID=A0ABP6Q7U0_9ACTN
MGEVWRGRDESLDREVAVKRVLLPARLSDGQRDMLFQRFQREARATARLSHPGIVTIHDVGTHDGVPFLVMEYMRGRSLGAEITARGRLEVSEVAAIGATLADGLAEAHRAGIVHRDLKPDNVLLAGRRAVITDFGIASLIDATALTTPGSQPGTPLYMAPEQIEGRPPTSAADLWSLGATLYTAVEGRPPFPLGTSMAALFHAILSGSPRAPERAGPLEPVLATLLHRDPGRRASGEAVAEMLGALAGPVHAPRPGAAPAGPAAGPRAASAWPGTDSRPGPHLHPARLAWECGRMIVRGAETDACAWLADRLAAELGPSYRERLAVTRSNVHRADSARYSEAGAWRAHLDRLFSERPGLVTVFAELLDELTARLPR